ncbi:hypothetical protein KCP74_21850 [Salmonella enterica subsp. enterica]|nr:hypothetical protein KCP74_21850 [Salmonella enterica subsp. enterica]
MRTTDRFDNRRAASWTASDEPARRLPEGRAQRVNPLTAISAGEPVQKYGLLFIYIFPKPGDENHRLFDNKTPGVVEQRVCLP